MANDNEGGAVSAAGEETIRSLLSSMQESMKSSKDSNNVDPLPLDNLDNTYRLSTITVNIRLTDMKLIGLGNFVIEEVKMNVQTLCVNVSLSYESIAVIGTYEFKGKLLKIIPLSGQGPFTATTAYPKVKLRARLKEKEGRFEVSTLVSELLLQGVKTRLSQLPGGTLVSRVLDNMLTELLHRPDIRQHLESHLSASLKPMLNNELKNFNLGLSLQLLQTSDKYIRRGSLY